MQRIMATLSLVVVVATGCSSTSATHTGTSQTPAVDPTSSGTTGWPTFRGEGLRFRHPPGSTVARYRDVTPAYDSLAYVSNQQMTNPCRSLPGGGGVCALAVTRLRPGGFVAVWRIRGMPVVSFKDLPGRVTEISGRMTKLSIARPGTCRPLGADVSIDAVLKPAGGGGTWYEFRGCVRGPNERQITRRTMNILRSTTLPSS